MGENSTIETVDLRINPTDQVKAAEVAKRKTHLNLKGFSSEFVNHISETSPTLYSQAVTDRHLNLLKGLGFENPVKMATSQPEILDLAEENIKGKIDLLKELGFENPVKLVSAQPGILGLAEANMREKINLLRELGFENPIKMITDHPAVFTYAGENFKGKIDLLRELGFENPIKMLTISPENFALAEENIRGKIVFLKGLGFENPTKVATALPQILHLSNDNIKGKIDLLKELGFKNPIRMLTASPTIFSLADENIKSRLRTLDKLISLYNLPISPVSLMEKDYYLFSTKLDKIWVLVRILREYKVKSQDMNENLIGALLRSNLENTLITLSQSDPENETIHDFRRRLRQFDKEKISPERKAEKRKIVLEELGGFEKIKSRYLRGYPVKTNA